MIRRLLLSATIGLLSVFAVAESPVEITTPELRGAVQPQLAVSPRGKTAAVYGKGNAIYFTADDGALRFSVPVKVGELEKLALKMRRGPRVAVTDQAILITAISHADGNLHAWFSSDGGKTFQPKAALNSVAGTAREGMHALAGDGNGKVALVWLDGRGGGTQLWGRFSTDGGATWGTEQKIYASPDGHICECCHPNVAFSPTGEIAVMWRNWVQGSRDLYAVTSRDLGKTFSPAQKLGEGTWKLNACPMDGGSVAASPAGKWSAVWRREAAVYTHPWGTAEVQVAQEGKQPVIGYAGKEPVIIWEQGKALQMQFGSGTVSRLTEAGAAPCIISGKSAVTIAYEAGGALFVTRFPK